MKTPAFQWHCTVRDYELDSQGIVNNATYLNYLEQCRNDYAKQLGVDFHQYLVEGYALVVAAIEIQYHRSLQAYDKFYVTVNLESYTDKRVIFVQRILRATTNKLVVSAKVTMACKNLTTGKSDMPEMLKAALQKMNAVAGDNS